MVLKLALSPQVIRLPFKSLQLRTTIFCFNITQTEYHTPLARRECVRRHDPGSPCGLGTIPTGRYAGVTEVLACRTCLTDFSLAFVDLPDGGPRVCILTVWRDLGDQKDLDRSLWRGLRSGSPSRIRHEIPRRRRRWCYNVDGPLPEPVLRINHIPELEQSRRYREPEKEPDLYRMWEQPADEAGRSRYQPDSGADRLRERLADLVGKNYTTTATKDLPIKYPV